MRRARWWLAAALFGPPGAYLLLALVLGWLQVNRGFVPSSEAAGGVPIYLRTNGVHADIVVPTRTPSIDWSEDFPAAHARVLNASQPWIAFGWGDRDFMVNTPTWRDLRPGTAFNALAGLGQGAMHVEYIAAPQAYDGRRIVISEGQYRRLVHYFRSSFKRAATGRPILINAPGFGATDMFYDAVPFYTFWFTCNEWTRRGLAAAGIRTAIWAPFEWALFWH